MPKATATLPDLIAELQSLGGEQYRNIFLNHGAPQNLYGVKVEELKKIQKRIGKDHPLSMQLFATGNSDAQYLAGLIADEKAISAEDLQLWATTASWHLISECTVAWVASESAHGWTLAKTWIEDKDPVLQSTGWATLSSLLAIIPNNKLDITWLEKQLQQVSEKLHASENRVRYTQNRFVIACGCFVPDLTAPALAAAKAIGPVRVWMGKTACKVPYATDYIQKCIDRGTIGKKKKGARC